MSIDEVYLFCLGDAGQTGHTHQSAEDETIISAPVLMTDVAHLEVEVTHATIGRGIVAEGVLRLGDTDGELRPTVAIDTLELALCLRREVDGACTVDALSDSRSLLLDGGGEGIGELQGL